MNKAILMGRLTRDPDIRYTQGDQPMAVARFVLAVDRRFKKEGDQQTADFISCVAFGKTAEFIERYCHQGTKIVVEGRIQTGSYTDREGRKVYTTDVVIEAAEFAESKTASAGQNQGSQENSPRNQDNSQNNKGKNVSSEVDEYGFMQIPDDLEDEGLPFCE
jgi:single-strand DNA-binding protein